MQIVSAMQNICRKNRRVPSKASAVCRIGIVLSGDAGFYSGAKKLEEVLNGSEERYEIQRIPGISSVVYFAAALHTSWEDAALVSLHGRWQNWIYEAEHHAKTFLLLGGRKENLKEKLCIMGLKT